MAATGRRVDKGRNFIIPIAPFCARMVSSDEIKLNEINGSFSIHAGQNDFMDWILLDGYQSKISNTAGRETAIGLLNRARAKKKKENRYCLFRNRDLGP